MAQTTLGAAKTAAQKIGISVEQYLEKVNTGQKWCYACRHWKTADKNFGRDASRKDGKKAKCSDCCYKRKTTGPSKKERQAKKTQGLSWCRGCNEWLATEKVRSGLCRPCTADAEKRRYHSDLRYQRDRKERAHARKRNLDPIPGHAQELLLDEFNGECAYCLSSANSWDHIIPVSKGGKTTPGNIVPCCISCNSRKKAMNLEEWILRCERIHPEVENRIILADAGLYG